MRDKACAFKLVVLRLGHMIYNFLPGQEKRVRNCEKRGKVVMSCDEL